MLPHAARTLVLLLSTLPGLAHAHGVWGHVHVTGWAVENMDEGELKQFLQEPEVFNALLFGAAFTDSGYAIDAEAPRAYSEHTHWEPFIEDFIEWIQVNDPPPWDSIESRKRVAFLMGCASHGLQDTLFDSLFLYQVEHYDSAGQGETDPATDGFLFADQHARFVPQTDMPMDTLLELYADLEADITEEVILDAVGLLTDFYVNDTLGPTVASNLASNYEPLLPWTRTHYMDPEVPGSLRSEIFPTMRYQEAIWARLHGTFGPQDILTHTFPEAPRLLRSHDHTLPDSWISMTFGAGISSQTTTAELTDSEGTPVPFSFEGTRWGASWTRLVTLKPDVSLAPGGWYTATLPAGMERIDGTTTTADLSFTFQVACTDHPEDCIQTEPIRVASVDGTGPIVIPGAEEPASRCGCLQGSPGAGWLLWSLFPLFRRRRAAR